VPAARGAESITYFATPKKAKNAPYQQPRHMRISVGLIRLCLGASGGRFEIFRDEKQLKDETPRMKLRISKTLKFWVEVAREQRKVRTPPKSKQSLIAQVLHEWEEAGEAMRYLRTNGKVAWKATPKMLERLADAERDAKEELDEWP